MFYVYPLKKQHSTIYTTTAEIFRGRITVDAQQILPFCYSLISIIRGAR